MNFIHSIGMEYFLRDIQLQNIHLNDSKDDVIYDDTFSSDKQSCVIQTYKLLDEPIVIQSSVDLLYQDRLDKLEQLGFQSIYDDEGQSILFHEEQNGICILDKSNCKIDSVFFDYSRGLMAQVNGIFSIYHIMQGKYSFSSEINNFSYKCLSFISESDKEKLPIVPTIESLVGCINQEQMRQFEKTGYIGDLDCSWAKEIILRSNEKRSAREEVIIRHKLDSLPKNVQKMLGYSSFESEDSCIVKKKSM